MKKLLSLTGLVVLMALPGQTIAEECRYADGRMTFNAATLNPKVTPLKEAVYTKRGQPSSVNMIELMRWVLENRSGCAVTPQGAARPGWDTPQNLAVEVVKLNRLGASTKVPWPMFAQKALTEGIRLPGFTATTPRRTAAAPTRQGSAAPKRHKPARHNLVPGCPSCATLKTN